MIAPDRLIDSKGFVSRQAKVEDAFQIMKLYADAYQGLYSDPLMSRYERLKEFLENENNFWFIVEYHHQVIASVVLRYDPAQLLAKAFGAVVKDEFRRHQIMEELLSFGISYVQKETSGADIVYATTRTTHEGAQALTEKIGFKKLGIFPNSHKTADYETHCLAATFTTQTLSKRFIDYKLHESLMPLARLVALELLDLQPIESIKPEPSTKILISPPPLEMIEAEHFVRFRYEALKKESALQFAFFPFHEANVLILSPDQSTELFCYLSRADGYSVILGGKVGENLNFTELFDSVSSILRDHQARYIETLIRADKPKIIESILKARFIPSAFFPAFQLHHEKRYDYVVMSKTYESFNFQNIKLKGLNQKFLEEYFRQWEKTSLSPKWLEGSFSN